MDNYNSKPDIYRSLDPSYEAAQIGIFLDMVNTGVIHRGID